MTAAAHIAQLNIGVMIAPTDDPSVAEFMDALDEINALADAAPGFVWRLQTEEGNATDIQIFPNPLQLVNMSVWETVESLKQYVYRSKHIDFFRRRAEWFERDGKRVALWSIAAGAIPELRDAVRRVEFLERHGASPYAFGFAGAHQPLVFESTDLDDTHTVALVERLNEELASVATEPGETHFDLTTAEVTGDEGCMIRARLDGALVGCGAIRRIAPTVGEVKRMFVDPSARGFKIGAAILDQLEQAAFALGLERLQLETGIHQPAAIALYERAGYEPIDPWGVYTESATTSRCFAKAIS